jgi:small subunit ribosomal protein S24e
VDLKIKEDNYNALLKRKEVSVEVGHDGAGTPSRVDLRKAVATKYGTKPENVYVVDVETKTGTQSAVCEVQVYDDAETAKRTVAKYIQTRNLPPEERKQVREKEKEDAAKKEEKKEGAKPSAEKAKGKEEQKPAPSKPEEKLKQEVKPEQKPPAEVAKKGKESEGK